MLHELQIVQHCSVQQHLVVNRRVARESITEKKDRLTLEIAWETTVTSALRSIDQRLERFVCVCVGLSLLPRVDQDAATNLGLYPNCRFKATRHAYLSVHWSTVMCKWPYKQNIKRVVRVVLLYHPIKSTGVYTLVSAS